MKKIISLILTITLVIGMTVTAGAATSTSTSTTGTAKEKKGYLALGKDLNDTQKKKVLTLLNVKESELSDYDIVYITNKEEHDVLDDYISSDLIGKKALSSVLVKPAKKGSGITVTTHNINYCTPNMYKNALITAGITDVDVTVAAPFAMSGTAALLGAIKAYEKMSGKAISETVVDTSVNELIAETEIAEKIGDAEMAEELFSVLKLIIATNKFENKKDIDAAINKVTGLFGIKLTTKEFNDISKLMQKIGATGLTVSVLLEQGKDIYAKYKDIIDAGVLDAKNLYLSDPELRKLVLNTLKSTMKDVDLSKILLKVL